ncbi:MAG: anti-sigma factor antagonist [Bacilli bacterium]
MLDIDMEFKQGILMVRLKGILNGDTVNLLKSDLEMVIKDNGIKYVLLNLKKLDYIDNYGLEAIQNSYKQIVNNKGKLIICGINKLFDKNNILTENLYQVNEEVTAYEIINI